VAIKSLVVPGWGQVSNGSWLKGGLFFAAWGGFLGWAVAINQDKQDAEGRLNEAETPEEIEFWESEVARLEDSRTSKIWFAGLTALLAMVDAYVDAHLKNFNSRVDADVAVRPDNGRPAWSVSVTLPWEPDGDTGR